MFLVVEDQNNGEESRMSAYVALDETGMFTQSRQRLDETVGWLDRIPGHRVALRGARAAVAGRGRELLRQLLQDQFNLRAVREERLPVVAGGDAVAPEG